MAFSGYGDSVVSTIPGGDGKSRSGWREGVGAMRLGLAGTGQRCGGALDEALSGIWCDLRAVWRPMIRDSMSAASRRLGLMRCLMLMGRETRLAGWAAIWGAAGCR